MVVQALKVSAMAAIVSFLVNMLRSKRRFSFVQLTPVRSVVLLNVTLVDSTILVVSLTKA